MAGISVVLDRARIGLWSDPSNQLKIPRLTAFPITVTFAGVTAQFVGDEFPTGFHGESTARSYALTCRYMKGEQADVAALLALFATAHAAADNRLMLRTHVGQVPGLDGCDAVQVFGVQPSPGAGLYWDVAFTAAVVESSVEV